MASGGRRPPIRWTWAVRDNRTLSSNAKLVWLTLYTRGADARPAVKTLADDCGLSARSVQRAISELSGSGWLSVVRKRTEAGDWDASTYLLTCANAAKGRVTQTPRSRQRDTTGGVTQSPKEGNGKGKTEVGNNQTSTRRKRHGQPGPGQEAMPGLLVAMPSVEIVARTPTAKDVVAAYCDGASEAGMPAPSKKSIGRVGRDAKRMLEAGADPAELVEAAGLMGAGPWDDLDRQVRLRRVRHQPARNGSQRISDGLALVAQIYEAEQAAGL